MGWMTDLNMLLSCFREKMSASVSPSLESESKNDEFGVVSFTYRLTCFLFLFFALTPGGHGMDSR